MAKQTKCTFSGLDSLPVLTVCSVLTLATLSGPPAAAQGEASLSACAQISAAEQRLACYDSLSGLSVDDTSSPGEEQTDTNNKIAPQAASSPTRQSTQIDTSETARDGREEAPTLESFGRDSNPMQARIERTGKDFELIDKVIALRQYHHARLEIRLSGGQLWRQTAARRFHLNEGEEVRIYPSNFGTDYRLSVKGRSGFIQVQRIE